jgi:hypothetical protein
MRFSHEDVLSSHEDVYSIFQEFGNNLANSIQIFIIGGAAMQYYNLKDSTKDIDIVCINQEERATLIESSLKSGFELTLPEKRHKNLDGLGRIAVRGPHTVDIFAETITGSYKLTSAMRKRAAPTKLFNLLEAKYTSVEDIFIMKLIANRKNDIEDCAKIVMNGLDFDIVYEEIKSQFNTDDGNDNGIWVTYIDQSIDELYELYHVDVPIAEKISALSEKWYEQFESTLPEGAPKRAGFS